MRQLVVIAHGSRRAAANQQVMEWVAELAETVGPDYARVQGAFLELAEPTMDAVLAEAGRQGDVVEVLPYFLAAGSHVMKDIPEAVARAQAVNPRAHYRLLPAVGGLPGFVAFVADHLAQAGDSGQ